MPFPVKGWQNNPGSTTPLNAAGLEDLESRLAGYTDAQESAEAAARASGDNASISAVAAERQRAEAAEALLAPRANPVFTGTPKVPTAAPGTNTEQAASTGFVHAAVAAGGGFTKEEADGLYVPFFEKQHEYTVTENLTLLAVPVTVHVLRLQTGSPVITLPATTVGSSITVYAVQDASGSRTPLFVAPMGVVHWTEKTLPSYTLTPEAYDILTFTVGLSGIWDGIVAGYNQG